MSYSKSSPLVALYDTYIQANTSIPNIMHAITLIVKDADDPKSLSKDSITHIGEALINIKHITQNAKLLIKFLINDIINVLLFLIIPFVFFARKIKESYLDSSAFWESFNVSSIIFSL